ncbi:hypothetical protein [Bosea sp. (in: a-proteobacteria)]|jgi:hypothetical protein|uniref:hypothetical protein n=1 Tax=Bosea sp. (in: a-proteobacteria) TaxID=1871050 RepID=UPI003F72788F
MAQSADPLVLDLVEWVAREPRPYAEVMETWRTSCPRLSIWEDAVDRGYVARMPADGRTMMVAATEFGRAWLRDNGRLGEASFRRPRGDGHSPATL